MSGAEIVGVTGGETGIAATYDEVRGLADAFDDAGAELRAWATDGLRALVDPDLVSSAPLSPPTFAAAEAALLAATTGPGGLVPEAVGWEGDAVLVRAALLTLEAGDEAVHQAIEAIDWRLGFVAGTALRYAAPALVATASALPPEARARLESAAQRVAVHHPGLVEHAVNGSGGLLSGLAGLPLVADNRAASALLAAAYDDGHAVTVRRDDLVVPGARVPPASLAGLVGHLRSVAALSPDPDSADNGTIEVQTLGSGGPDDPVRHVVYLPGTDDLGTRPWTQDDDVRDLGTDLRSAAGEQTAYRRGILRAMAAAGIGPHDPVLLVGHSLGGMEAAAIASRDSGFHVTDVVTAGSPTAQVGGFPDGVHVLSLEHRGDVVPLLDGEPNPDSTAQVTVTFDDPGTQTVEAMHGYDHYVAGAAAADASGDPAVAAARRGLHDRGFLAADRVLRAQVFQVWRGR